jgi:hypothetical protein
LFQFCKPHHYHVLLSVKQWRVLLQVELFKLILQNNLPWEWVWSLSRNYNFYVNLPDIVFDIGLRHRKLTDCLSCALSKYFTMYRWTIQTQMRHAASELREKEKSMHRSRAHFNVHIWLNYIMKSPIIMHELKAKVFCSSI